jgi:hypothetical protein
MRVPDVAQGRRLQQAKEQGIPAWQVKMGTISKNFFNTGGPASDHKVNYPACSLYFQEPKNNNRSDIVHLPMDTMKVPKPNFTAGDKVTNSHWGDGRVISRSYDNLLHATDWLYQVQFENHVTALYGIDLTPCS